MNTIKEFATPANFIDLRLFIGLANQLADLSPDISASAQPL